MPIHNHSLNTHNPLKHRKKHRNRSQGSKPRSAAKTATGEVDDWGFSLEIPLDGRRMGETWGNDISIGGIITLLGHY